MKKTTRLLAVGISAVSLLLLNTPRAGAQSTDVLKEMGDLLQKQGQQIQELLIGRAEDQKKIQHLEQLVGETGQKAEQSQRAANNAPQKAAEIAADVAARVQTLQSGPSEEASATRNFLLTGMADMT